MRPMCSKLARAAPRLALSLLLAAFASPALAACAGRIPNPLTDVCWSCVLPIEIQGFCLCGLRPGFAISFWEPARAAEVVREPFCSPLLGGLDFGTIGSVAGGDNHRQGRDQSASYHLHWMVYPLASWLGLLADFACIEPESFDVAYLSELDPTWQNDALGVLFNPEALLLAHPVAQAACAADCLAASFNRPLDELFWCAGCQGSLYPFSGNHSGHESGLEAGLLSVMRLHAKLHRTGVARDAAGNFCGLDFQPIMRKSNYRQQMLSPFADALFNHAYGKQVSLWGIGRQFPVAGEDWGFLMWRKRSCCLF